MSEFESSFDFTEIDDDGLDIAAIFGDSNADAAQPHELFSEEPDTKSASTPETQDVQPEPVSVQQPQEEFASPDQSGESADRGDDLFAALTPKGEISQKAVKSVQDTPDKQVSLFDKPPIFSYGGVKEEIKDPAITFEELRISKASDFPELLDGKKVTWSVSYGKTTKTIPYPAGTTIASMKEEIEKSKTFLDMLKKAKEKDRSPDCLVTPKLTAQSKGIASYKGIFISVEEARASDKAICLIPSSDGQIYEMRRTEMGDFIAPKHNIVDFSAVRAGFFPALPLIPRKILAQIIAFFRCLMDEQGEFEALAHIYWDKEQKEFTVSIPRQRVSKAAIDADLRGSVLPEDRYIHYADIHSHNSMAAKFSYIDDEDEKATRLYFVVGHLDRFCPSIAARISCGGVYQNIDPALVLEGFGEEFPCEWLDQVECDVNGPKMKKGHWQNRLGDLLAGLPEALLA